ncbi:MAG TPA: FtsX-like permease family protein [Bdellovibrionota bacterium]|jgi:putative ABC transport system permease protein
MKSFWLLSLRNLGRNRKRNFATGSAIALGFAGILMLAAYQYRAVNYARVYTVYVVHTGHLAIFAPGGLEKFAYEPLQHSLSADDQAALVRVLKEEPEVERFEPQIRGQGLIGNGCASFPFIAQGYDPAADKALREHPQVRQWMPHFSYLLRGRGIWEFEENMGAILLSQGLALTLGKTKLHDEVAPDSEIRLPDCTQGKAQAALDANVQLMAGAWAGNVSAVDGEVVGLFTTGFQESDNSGIVTSVSHLQKLFGTDRVTQFAVWLKNPEKITEVSARIEANLSSQGKTFDVLRWDDAKLSPYYSGTAGFLRTLLIAGSLVLATIVTLSVLNSSTMTILERSQEIGMYRSMGFRRAHLRHLYVQESLWLSLLSLFTGAILGLLAIQGVNALKILYHPPGVAGGLYLFLVLPWAPAIASAALILLLVSLATYFAVSSRLRPSPADLLGGTLR